MDGNDLKQKSGRKRPATSGIAIAASDPFRDAENYEIRYLTEDEVNDEDLVRYWRSGYEL